MVLIHDAWLWRCDECDAWRVAHSVPVELNREEMQEMWSRYGIHHRPGLSECHPNIVICEVCGAIEEAELSGVELDDNE